MHTNSLKCRMSNKSSSEWAAWPAVCFKLKQEMALSRGSHSLAPGLAQVVLNGFNKRQAEQLQRKEDHSQLLFHQSIGWLAGIYDGLDYGKVAKITKIGTLHHLHIQKYFTSRRDPLHKRKKSQRGFGALIEALIPRANFVVPPEDASSRRRRKSFWRCIPILNTEATERG